MVILAVAMFSLCLNDIIGMMTAKATAIPLWVCDREWLFSTSLVGW